MSTYQPVGRDLAPCGTDAAYRRHLRHREPPCEACKQASRTRPGRSLGEMVPDRREVRNGIPWKPYVYNGLGYDLLWPDHEPGPDCPNAPHTCLICQPKLDTLRVEALLRQVIHVLACALGAGRQQP